MEVASGEEGGFFAAEFAKLSEEDGADGNVDADAEGIGPADDLQQSALGELFDEEPIFWKKTGVVNADTMADPAANFRAVGGGEVETLQRFGKGGLFEFGAKGKAHEITRVASGFKLGEVDDVNRGLPGEEEGFEGGKERGLGVLKIERNGSVSGGDQGRVFSGESGEFSLEEGGVPQGGGHEEETSVRECQEGDLPGNAPGRVGVEMELVEDDVRKGALIAHAQGQIGEDLRSAAEDGSLGVDACVPGAEANVCGAELLAKGEPLFIDEGFDRRGVNGASTLSFGKVVQGGSDQRFSGAGGGVQDDVFAVEEFEDGGLLGRVELEGLGTNEAQELI